MHLAGMASLITMSLAERGSTTNTKKVTYDKQTLASSIKQEINNGGRDRDVVTSAINMEKTNEDASRDTDIVKQQTKKQKKRAKNNKTGKSTKAPTAKGGTTATSKSKKGANKKSKARKSKASKPSSKSKEGEPVHAAFGGDLIPPPSAGQVVQPPPREPRCFTTSTYDAIDGDIARLQNDIADDKERSHFLGGIVRLAAHDFMDHDRRDRSNQMGPDGCYDVSHPSNDGLETIWCQGCKLTLLYERKYSHLSRADYWIAAANAVIKQTSLDNALDLRDTFTWGRKDRNICSGSGERLPEATGCNQIEDVFLTRMGLGWKDAVALMGAHTIGRGDKEVSLQAHIYTLNALRGY